MIALIAVCWIGGLRCAEARASISPTSSASTLAQAIVADPATLVSASFEDVPNGGTPTATATTVGTLLKPWVGPTMGVLSSGDATAADTTQTSPDFGGTAPSSADNNPDVVVGGAHDVTVLRVNVNVPAYANCAAVNADYLTNDATNDLAHNTDYTYSQFVDGWIVRLDPSTMWSLPAFGQAAPDLPPTGDLAVTTTGFMFDADVMVFPGSAPHQAAPPYPGFGAGTPYNVATGWNSVVTPVTPGPHTFEFSIFDRGDQVFDSTVLFDGLSFFNTDSCATGLAGSIADTPPTVTLDSPADGSSTTDTAPVLRGSFGTERDALSQVTVQIYAGTQADGSPLQTLSASDTGSTWSANPSRPLAVGTYTVQAVQHDLSGDTVLSSAHTFRVIHSTATGITSSANPSVVDEAVTYTATVSPAPDGGTVAFTDGGSAIAGCAAVAVNAVTGTASCGTTDAFPGSRTILASYSGDTNFGGSQSAPLTQVATLLAALARAPKWNGRSVTAKITCAASATTPCRTSETLKTIETTVRGRPVAVAAARQKRRRRTILIGTHTVLIQPGETKTVTVVLNGTGRNLLKQFARLPVTVLVTVVQGGQNVTVARAHVTVRPRKKHHRK